MKRKLFLLINFSFLFIISEAQENLTLQKAHELAQQHYPLIRQRELLKQTSGYSVDNLSKGFLPQLSFNGQATYQSEVTQVKVPIPGVNIESPSKDQYKILADVNQLIYDGGVTKQQKNIQLLSEEVEQQKIEIELYKLKDRINQLFLGILFLDEQMKQVELVKNDLNTGIKKVQAQVDNGVAFRSNLNVLKAELLKADQKLIELQSTRKGFLDVLSIFINQSLAENIKLIRPVADLPVQQTDILRPELKLLSTQEKLINSQFKLIDSRNKPKASLFWQGGYGRPGLNFLNNQFDFFYTTGIRLSWTIGGYYTQKNEKRIIELNQKSIGVQKDVFLLNTNTQLAQQQAEISKLQQLITTDEEIIDLRIKVKDAAKVQLENGVITANDYLREVNAEDQARQSLITHQLQLLQAQISYQTIAGK